MVPEVYCIAACLDTLNSIDMKALKKRKTTYVPSLTPHSQHRHNHCELYKHLKPYIGSHFFTFLAAVLIDE